MRIVWIQPRASTGRHDQWRYYGLVGEDLLDARTNLWRLSPLDERVSVSPPGVFDVQRWNDVIWKRLEPGARIGARAFRVIRALHEALPEHKLALYPHTLAIPVMGGQGLGPQCLDELVVKALTAALDEPLQAYASGRCLPRLSSSEADMLERRDRYDQLMLAAQALVIQHSPDQLESTKPFIRLDLVCGNTEITAWLRRKDGYPVGASVHTRHRGKVTDGFYTQHLRRLDVLPPDEMHWESVVHRRLSPSGFYTFHKQVFGGNVTGAAICEWLALLSSAGVSTDPFTCRRIPALLQDKGGHFSL